MLVMKKKQCIKCKERKYLKEFSFRKDSNRHRNCCMKCMSNKSLKYYRKNIEHCIEYKKRYYRENREKILELRKKQYKLKNEK